MLSNRYRKILIFGIFILFFGAIVGNIATVSNQWEKEGSYCIKAKPMDIWDDSSLSNCFELKIGNQPPDPPIIEGPRCGEPGEELTFTFVSEDFEGQAIYYYIDWDDGTINDWFGPFPSGEKVTASHSWDVEGDYEIKAIAKDSVGSESVWSIPYFIKIGYNSPPEAPSIDGPKKGYIGQGYGYIFVTIDPDGDKVIYEINWGDGKIVEKGPYISGEEVVVNHAWELPGIYIIKARGRDEFCGFNSEWSEYEVNIPRNRALNINLMEWFFKQLSNEFLIIKYLFNLKSLYK